MFTLQDVIIYDIIINNLQVTVCISFVKKVLIFRNYFLKLISNTR